MTLVLVSSASTFQKIVKCLKHVMMPYWWFHDVQFAQKTFPCVITNSLPTEKYLFYVLTRIPNYVP